jgi:hypothetical protein
VIQLVLREKESNFKDVFLRPMQISGQMILVRSMGSPSLEKAGLPCTDIAARVGPTQPLGKCSQSEARRFDNRSETESAPTCELAVQLSVEKPEINSFSRSERNDCKMQDGFSRECPAVSSPCRTVRSQT